MQGASEVTEIAAKVWCPLPAGGVARPAGPLTGHARARGI